MTILLRPIKCLLLISVFLLAIPRSAGAYSVLTHEALIDVSWEKHILPLLKQKYPSATPAELKSAHGYAYGGALIADMGYFPFGSVYFTNLAHYVRSGDFVEALLNESRNLNEYAFSVGALCHYMADQYGHSLGTNVVVPIVYPKIKEKFGPVVTYEDDHKSHSRVEISFDVLQIARGYYASQAYHNFVGFNVAKPVLERAFLKTYGQDINKVFGDFDLAISTFRWSVKSLLPTITRTAWVLRKNEIKKDHPTATSEIFEYKMSRKAYYKEFGGKREKPTFGDKMLAFFVRVLPKVGPLKALKFKDPGPEGEKIFIKSFDTVLVHYNDVLTKLKTRAVELKDMDYDTGKPTEPGEYKLADETYNELVYKLADTKFNDLTASLKQNITAFYNSADTTKMAQTYVKDWKKTAKGLKEIKVAKVVRIDSLKNAKGDYYKLNEPPAGKPTGS